MRGSPIPIPPPGSDECRKMAVSFIQGDRVVAIPRVEHGLFGEAWNGSSLVEGGWAVVGFPGGVPVQWLEVDGPPERPVLLGAYHHAVAPSDGCAQGDFLQHAESDISVEAGFNLVLPVNWYRDGRVARLRCGIGIDG